MPRATCLAVAVLVLLSGSVFADSPRDPAVNAALKYWQAFATLPRLAASEKAKLEDESQTMPLDDRTREIVDESTYALDMMRRGAALPRCDWAIGWADEGLLNRLPYFDGARTLSSLAGLRARQRFEDGQNVEAVEDILATITMGRHISLDGSLPSILLRNAIERRASETLAIYLPKLGARELRDLKKRLDTLLAGGSLGTAVREEQLLETGHYVRKLKEAKDEKTALAFLIRMWNSADEARLLLDECGGTSAGVVKYTEELRTWYPQLAKQMELPLDQFEKEQERAEIKFASNPMYERFVPGILRCRGLQAQADVRRALLLAAVDVLVHGRDGLKNHSDPVAGGAFDYVAFEGGFELRSKWKLDEKLRSKRGLDRSDTLVLVVGRRGK
jgi:hypothetical protein